MEKNGKPTEVLIPIKQVQKWMRALRARIKHKVVIDGDDLVLEEMRSLLASQKGAA